MKKNPPKVQTHPFVEGESDHATLHPRTLCAECGYPKANRRHDLKATPDDVTAAERRRLGESE